MDSRLRGNDDGEALQPHKPKMFAIFLRPLRNLCALCVLCVLPPY